jgi:SAM-dependent methyltransferase
MLQHDASWWSRQKLVDVSSYTLSSKPVWLLEAFQSLFRNLVVARIGEFANSICSGRQLGKVVDLACGAGDWTLKYLDFAERVVGVDISRAFIDSARRAARAHQNPERAEFVHANLLDYQGYSEADLVCLGACLQCMNDGEVDKLFEVLARELRPGTCVYVRTNIAHPFLQSYRTARGCYRTKHDYEQRFQSCGIEIADTFTSASVIPAQIAGELSGVRSFQTARMLGSPLWLVHRLGRMVFSRSDHNNWFLVKK